MGYNRAAYTTTFTHGNENRPTNLSYGGYGQSTLTYDKLGRVKQSSVKAGSGTAMTTTYAFVEGGHGTNSTTGLVKSITQTGGNFTYTYDDNGNIVSVVQDGKKTAYTYDALGQLIRVDDQQENATWVYEYDQGGNILSKKKYAYGVTTGEPAENKTFTYGNANWKDQLTAVNGTPITYDAIGNPLSDGEWTYTWQNGRQLASMSKSGTTASFKYNENGLRVQKTVNGVTTDYTLHGKNIVHMKQGSNNLHFFYDASNKPAVVVYNGTAYSYIKNLQGDIVAILNSTDTAVVRYVYDAWGRPISCTGTMAATLGKLNPFRYRGYVYDEENGLYYLRSRYFYPQISRFLQSDIVLKGNLYCYCNNSTIATSDSNGYIYVPCTNPFHSVFVGEEGDGLQHAQNHTSSERMTLCQFLAFAKQMVDEGWEYQSRTDGGISYGHVDCVGVYRYAMYWYYSEKAYRQFHANATSVTGVYNNALYNKPYGTAITKKQARGDAELHIGMALIMGEMKRNTDGKTYFHGEHIAVYVGDYFSGYTNGVIESAANTGYVVLRELSDSEAAAKREYNYIGYFRGIDYEAHCGE